MSTAVNRTQGASASRGRPQQRGLLVVGVVVVVVVIALIAIIALGGARTGSIDFSNVPMSRASDGGFVVGNPDAPVTIIEFADFACPHCQEYQPTMHDLIVNHVLTGQAKFEYRMFPTAGGDLSVYTGKLLECADKQRAGAFWEGYNLMFQYATSGRYTREVGRTLATDLNLNYADLLECSSDANQVNVDISFGSSSGVTGTPSTMIRYGNGGAQFITYGGTTYDRGGAPSNVLSAVITAANQS